MLRQRHQIELTADERKTLTDLTSSASEDIVTKKKAEALLLADVGNHESCLMVKDIAERLGISVTTVKRTRYAFIENGGIEFLIPKKNTPERVPEEPSSEKKVSYAEQELELPGCEPSNRAKYRVVLTEEEREELGTILSKGKHSKRKIARTKILLHSDEGPAGPALQDEEIAEIAETSARTVQRVRKIFVGTEGIQGCINFKHKNAGRKRKLDGRGEAHLVTLVCGSAPEGRAGWTLRLLADKLVELELVDDISHVSVGATLKKTNLSLGKNENG